MIATLIQFFQDIHRMSQNLETISTCIAANRTQDVNVTLNTDHLRVYKRRQAKKVQA